MRIINGLLYIILFVLLAIGILGKKQKTSAIFSLYIGKHIHYLLLLLLVNSVSFGISFHKEENGIYIKKEDYGGSEQTVHFWLEKGEDKEQVALQVRPRKLTREEEKEKMEEAFAYLDQHLPGENPSLLEVRKDLEFTLDYERYPFDAEFMPEDYILMNEEGCLRNSKEELLAAGYREEDLEKGIATRLRVVLWYGEDSREKIYEILLFPKEETETEKLFGELQKTLEKREKSALYQEGFTIPSKLQGVHISRTDENLVTPVHVLVLGFLFIGLLIMREKENARKEEQCRRNKLIKSYPWFVNEMMLLMGAGMQVKNVFGIMLEEYGDGEKDVIGDRKPLMDEIRAAKHSMEFGMSEEQVYYQLGRRLKLSCYIKLMTLLEQNVKKGTKGISAIFEQEELAALEERKNLAKKYGEEAATRLLGPMILLLLVIMLMIMVPAFMSFL